MDILLWIVFGLVVGLVARLIMPGPDPGGIIITVVLGIVGAMLGGWLGRVMGLYRQGEAAGFIRAVVGAIILLGLYLLRPPIVLGPHAPMKRAISSICRSSMWRPRCTRQPRRCASNSRNSGLPM